MVDYTALEELAGTVDEPMNAQLHEAAVRLRAGDKIAALRLVETARMNTVMKDQQLSSSYDTILIGLRAEIRAEHNGNIATPTQDNGVLRGW